MLDFCSQLLKKKYLVIDIVILRAKPKPAVAIEKIDALLGKRMFMEDQIMIMCIMFRVFYSLFKWSSLKPWHEALSLFSCLPSTLFVKEIFIQKYENKLYKSHAQSTLFSIRKIFLQPWLDISTSLSVDTLRDFLSDIRHELVDAEVACKCFAAVAWSNFIVLNDALLVIAYSIGFISSTSSIVAAAKDPDKRAHMTSWLGGWGVEDSSFV